MTSPQTKTPIDRIVRPAETAQALGVSQATLYRMIEAGQIAKPFKINPTGHSVGWRMSQIEAYLAQRQQTAGDVGGAA